MPIGATWRLRVLCVPIILMGALGILDMRQATGRLRPTVPLCPAISQSTIVHLARTTSLLLPSCLILKPLPPRHPISKFQLIINNALNAYKKRTKNDLLAHPLAPQLQACDSPEAIIAVLQQQIQGIDQSRSDDRWTKWLDPTVNVLFAFSSTLSAGIGLVCSKICAYPSSALSYLFGRCSHPLV